MKKKLISCIFAFVTILTFVACEESNTDSYPPTWHGFRLEPYPPVAGENLTVTAAQSKKGHLINATTYIWSLSCSLEKGDGTVADTVITTTQKTNYDGISNANPTHRFIVPANAAGRATVSFEARYAYSADGIQASFGSDYTRPEDVRGNINSYSGTLSGGAKGSITFYIQEK